MRNVLNLSGAWKLTYHDLKNSDQKWGRWIDAVVPSDVQMDLMNAHLIAEPLVSDNNHKNAWIEGKKWWYKKTFFIESGFLQNYTELLFKGLDLTSEICVNGIKIASTHNMFIEHSMDVTPYIQEGVNEILVGLDTGLESVKDKPLDKLGTMWNYFEKHRTWLRKAQQCFYWDVAPRVVTCGIWRDVLLNTYQSAHIEDVYIKNHFDDNEATLDLLVELKCHAQSPANYMVQTEVRFGHEIYTGESQFFVENICRLSIDIPNPRLWWPNNMGDQNLYSVTVKLCDQSGRVLDEKTQQHGIRKIEVVQEDMGEDRESFTFRINGRKIFAKGGNWVPPDALYARISNEKEEKLLQLAKEANFNMIRVWGGGIYPDTNFYDLCDEKGIMVWQDFMFACGYYPDFDVEFCENISGEIRQIVKKYRSHACLALWCANNENQVMFGYDESNGRVHHGLKIYDEIIPSILKELDTNTFYWPSSPFSGYGRKISSKAGDQHCWDYTLGWKNNEGDSVNVWDYTKHRFTFLSEFGYFAPSNLSSVRKYLGENMLKKDDEMYNFHVNHFGIGYVERMLQLEYHVNPILDMQEFTLAGQMVHSEMTKHVFDEFRARMFDCSGLIFWEFNDCWGHLGYSPVDYYLSLKAAYYTMKRCFAPVRAVINKEDYHITVINETSCDKSFNTILKLMRFDGRILWEENDAIDVKANDKDVIKTGAGISLKHSPANHVVSGEQIPAGVVNTVQSHLKSTMLYVELYENNVLVDTNRLFLTKLRNIAYPESILDVRIVQLDDLNYEITLEADVFTHMVSIVTDDEYTVADNFFDLMPRETKKVLAHFDQKVLKFEPKIYSMNQLKNAHPRFDYKEELY